MTELLAPPIPSYDRWPEGLISSPDPMKVALATAGNGAFSTTFPGFQHAIDSTSLGDFKRCPRYYFYSMICGLSGGAESPHLTFGLMMHGASEHYAHARAIGMGHDDALDAALEWVLGATWDRKLGRPWMSTHPLKTRKSLVQTVVWYLDQFEHDPLETVILENGKPAVELSFSFDSGYRVRGEIVTFRGHFDRLAMLGGHPVIPDLKTTVSQLNDKWFAGWTPGNQFSMYALAGKIVYGFPVKSIVVDGIQVGAGFARFHRRPVPRSEDMIQEWHRDAGRWIGNMADCAERADWPMNDKACDMYGGCQFRELCSRSPVQRETWARGAYRKRTWDPTIARGDI
jgi:hypothetical protein